MAYRLGIDVGATSVAAAASVDGAPARMIMLGSDRPQLPTTLYVDESGDVFTGEEAVRRSAVTPARSISDPMRRLAEDMPAYDDGTDHLAAESGVAALLAAALRAATSQLGGPPVGTVVTHPVGWDDYQRACLTRAAEEADLPDQRLEPDLVAAGRSVVARADPGPDARFLIIDLGGGSCAVGLARRTPDAVELVAHEQGDHPCGADFDEAVFRLVGGNLGDQGRELTRDDPEARARAVEVRRACRAAKEILSTAAEASVTVGLPGSTTTVRIGRAEFESLVRPGLREVVALVTRMLSGASTTPEKLLGVALVGGASRMPVVAELVEREWGLPVVVSPEPELDAAAGLVTVVARSSRPAPVGAATPPPPDPAPVPIPVPVRPQIVMPAPAPVTPPPAPRPAVSTAPLPPPPVPTEQPMPENLIFDYFSSRPTEPLPAVPSGAAMASSPRSPQVAASMPPPPQRPGGPGQRPGPPGPPGAPGAPRAPGQRPGPPYGGGGHGPGGPGGYPPQAGGDGPSRRNLILAIVGGVVLVAAAVGIGYWLFKPDTDVVTGTPGGQISSAPATGSPAAPTGPSTPVSAPPSGSATPSGPAGPSTSSPASSGLPAGPPLAPSQVIIPMRTSDDDDDERPFYLVDAGGGTPTKIDGPDGKLANPMLQKDRTSIIFLEGGVLHVMGSDGNGERELTDREPAGCDNVAGASWSQADPATMIISCRLGKNNFRMLVVDTDGRLIRRLDAGEKRFGDVTISPDGQTVLYWASGSTAGDGGSLYTLPLVGTGAPKKITSGAKGLDGDPSWSPDGSQIAFRRLVGGAGGNADVYVMNADGSGQRAVADTKAADIKPVWSPDGKNLLVVSNRKSAFGSAGKTSDLWLTRVSDGEVLSNFDLEAEEITTPTWIYR